MPRAADKRPGRRKLNPLRARGLDYPDWKDTALLRQFISDRGKIRARPVTGLTPRQQRAVAVAIRNAREMALLPYPSVHPDDVRFLKSRG